jgi:hypothetical protein
MLKRIVLRYDPVEDRILVRLVTDQTQHGVLLTRRLATRWRHDLDVVIERSAQLPERLDPVARATIAQAHHQAMAAQAQLRAERRDEVPPMPMRPVPELAVGVACGQRRSDGRWLIRFTFAQDRECTVALSPESLHGLVEVLDIQMRKAGWLPPPSAPATPLPPTSANPLH